MTKFEKLQHLAKLGLNVPECVLVKRGGSGLGQATALILKNNGASLRTFTDEGSGLECPHYPNRKKGEATELLAELSEKYNVMVAQPIDPKAALAAGTVETNGTKDPARRGMIFTLYCSKDGAKVRDVVQDNKVNLIFKLVGFDDLRDRSSIPEELKPAVEQARLSVLATDMNEHVFEVSLYDKPMGTQGHKVICWECYVAKDISRV